MTGNNLPPCPNPNLTYTDALAADPVFQDLTMDAKAVYLLLLARAENGIIDDELREVLQGKKSDWQCKLSMLELAVAKLVAHHEKVMFYLPRFSEHTRRVTNG